MGFCGDRGSFEKSETGDVWSTYRCTLCHTPYSSTNLCLISIVIDADDAVARCDIKSNAVRTVPTDHIDTEANDRSNIEK